MATNETDEPIFVWENGRPCHIFVEATSVRERPKLVRRIIRHGGTVVNSVRDAEILLAENNTKEALDLLDAWGDDKVILATRWIVSCLNQGQLLGERHDWSGHLLNRESLVKGISIRNDDDECYSEAETKRVSRPHAKAGPQQPKSESRPSRPRTSDTDSPSRTKRRRTIDNCRGSERENSVSKAFGIQMPSEDRSASNIPSPTDPGPSSSQFQYPPSSQSHTQQQLLSSIFNQLLPQLPPQQQLQNMFPSPVLTQFGSFPPLATPYAQFSPNQIQLLQQLMNPQLLGPQAIGQQPNAVQQEQLADYDKVSEHSTPNDLTFTDVPYARSDSEKSRPPYKSKGKARKRSESYDNEVQTAIRSKPIPSKHQTRGMFVNDRGKPKTFYIMVDLKNRKDLLRIARKHHGAIVSEMELADYIILNTRSKQFQTLIGTLPTYKVALAPAWLESCDKQGRMLDMAPFVIDITSGIGSGARKRPFARKQPEATTAECESEEEIAAMTVAAAPQQHLESVTNVSHSRSHSPSPPTHVVEFNNGRNAFTEEDRAWFFDYLRFKLERDPDMSMTSLIKLVASKAQHHSARSWESAWRRSWGDEMTVLRKDIAQLSKRSAGGLLTSITPSTVAELQNSSQKTLTKPSASPKIMGNKKDVSRYPGDSSPLHSVAQPPPSTAPSPQTGAPATPTRIKPEVSKRKERSPEGHLSLDNGVRPAKKPKVRPEDVIDVDSYPET